MIMPQPYTSLIPKHIAWYPDVATFARSGMVAPNDNTRPQKLWPALWLKSWESTPIA